MTIKTKFDIRQKVWAVKDSQQNGAILAFPKARKILGISVIDIDRSYYERDEQYLIGHFTADRDWYHVSDCFSSKAKAQAECDRRKMS